MTPKKSNLVNSKSEFIRSYEVKGGGFEYTENMYVDRQSGDGALESIPGFRRLYDFGDKVKSLLLQDLGEGEKYLIIHAGDGIFRINVDDKDALSDLAPIATVEGDVVHAFSFGDDVYLMDGVSILRIDRTGKALQVSDEGELEPYVPTLYLDGVKCEERNLLTNKFIQRHSIRRTEEYTLYSDDLTYSVIDHVKKHCAVTGTTAKNYTILHIPPTVEYDGEIYKVTEIADYAFKGSKVVMEVYTPNNLEHIGSHAFEDCYPLERVVLADTVRSIGKRAFYNDATLTDFYLGLGFEEFGEESLVPLTSTHFKLYYAGDEEDVASIKGFDGLGLPAPICNTRDGFTTLGFPIRGDIERLDKVTLGGEKISFGYFKDRELLLTYCRDKFELVGKELYVEGVLNPLNKKSFIPTSEDTSLASGDIIPRCSLATPHDGRIFLSGNTALPGVVFYSSKDKDGNMRPLYFAENDFFVDGVSNYPITSMLSAHGTLTVFKAEDDGSGSIFCHACDTDSKGRRHYPLSYTHGGVSVRGGSYTLYDDALFLSTRGVCALEKVAGSNYRALRCRSTDINDRLLDEDLPRVRITEWKDYLVLNSGGRIYLGDAGDRPMGEFSFEYKWYYLNGIGTYSGDSPVYRYSESAQEGYEIKKASLGEATEGTVMSVRGEDGELIYYVEEDGCRYSVYPTEEMSGGEFHPASAILGVGELLFFGTEGGVLCLFNSDKRGAPPPYAEEGSYGESFGDVIHPYYYTFDNHAVSYIAVTCHDDCDVPHLEKRTLPHSLILKCKTYPRSNVKAEVSVDRGKNKTLGKFSAGRLTFTDTDFSSFSFVTAPYRRIRIPERECGWVEKQITLSSNEFRSPIGIVSLIYRFGIKGIIKN